MYSSNNFLENRKIVKNYLTIGLNEKKIMKYNEEENMMKFVQNIDIIRKNLGVNLSRFNSNTNDKLLLNKGSNYWLRIKYNKKYDNPLTLIKVIECNCNKDGDILIPKTEIENGFIPISITREEIANETEIQAVFMKLYKEEFEYSTINDEKNYIVSKQYNIKDVLEMTSSSQAAVLAVNRNKTIVPIKDISIINEKNGFKFGITQAKEPFAYKYMPDILDAYPGDEKLNPGISMFCFPEGISITANDDLPKWFTFILTDQEGKKIYCSCLIISEPITQEIIDAVKLNNIVNTHSKIK